MTAPASPSLQPAPTPTLEPSAGPSASGAGPSTFAFDPESIALFYASRGYACSDPAPSNQAADHVYQSCDRVDEAGRRLVIGLVSDADGNLANAFASVEAAASETFLDPVVALEPLAGFLGATLGEGDGATLLPWLAGHLGDTYATTMLGELTIATYTPTSDDHTTILVELATPGYLSSPTPAPA